MRGSIGTGWSLILRKQYTFIEIIFEECREVDPYPAE